MSEAKHFSKALTHVLEEGRMVLPGIQALFGFQLISVFSPVFAQQLDETGRLLHLAATALIALSIALVMTPAAYHRQCSPDGVSEDFIRLASKLLILSMIPLGIATSIELFLIATIVLERLVPSALLGVGIASTFGGLWFVLPWVHARRACGTDRSSRHPDEGIEPAPQG